MIHNRDIEEWLARTQAGYSQLKLRDRSALTDFTIVWTVFEAQALNSRGNPNSILGFVDSHAAAFLDLSDLDRSLAHFRQRYVVGDGLSGLFDGLHWRPNDRRDLVERVLLGRQSTPDEVVAALLLIVYRLRNNLFHGLKWTSEMWDQGDNFEQATWIMMWSLDRVSER